MGSCGREAMRRLRSRKKRERKGRREGRAGEGNEALEGRVEEPLSIQKHDAINGREKTRHDVYEYRPDQYNKGSPASASVDRKSFFPFFLA